MLAPKSAERDPHARVDRPCEPPPGLRRRSRFVLEEGNGDVAESVDASDLKSDGFGRAGSSPAVPTKHLAGGRRLRWVAGVTVRVTR